MNSHQRRKNGCAKHYRMPLGCAVAVTYPDALGKRRTLIGRMGKHDSGQRCIVEFDEHNPLSLKANPHTQTAFAWVTYASVKPLAVHRVRPWWRVLREKRLKGL